MSTLIFYTTEGCHLCVFAEQMLAEIQRNRECAIDFIDISSDESLVDLYGIRIPVVKNKETSIEIAWPFQLEDLLELV